MRFLPLFALAALVPWCSSGQSAAKPNMAPTPPMGWNSWEAFRKDVSEDAIKAQADAMVRLGLRDAGYRYVVIDGGWKTSQRDASGNIVADPQKFPHGMKALADYVHSLGMKFGVHQPAGIKDCGHDEPGSEGHEERDAALFASWDFDFVKLDQCDYVHDPKMLPGAPNLDKITVRNAGGAVFSAEAEAPGNKLKGMARVAECERCSGGKDVAAIGYGGGAVELAARVPEAGRYTVEIQFEYPYYGQNRDHFRQMTFFLSANGGERKRIDVPYEIAKRYTTGTVSSEIALKRGNNTILLDNPLSQEDDVRISYEKMGHALEQHGREIMFSTSGAPRPWLWAQPVAQMCRTAGDIQNRWSSIMTTLDRHADVARFAAPNFWPDPDMLEVGAPPRAQRGSKAATVLTLTEQRTQFSLWAIMNTPLFISADLRHLSDAAKAILLNREAIAIDQDFAYGAGRRIRSEGGMEMFAKRLKDGMAVALLNRNESPAEIRVTAAELGMGKSAFESRDVWTGKSQRIANGVVSAVVEAHGVKMFRLRRD